MTQTKRSQARSAARLGAVQALYQQQMEGTKLAKLLDEFHQHRLGRVIEDDEYAEADVDFFDDVVAGVDARREEIDGLLTARLAQGWTLARLDKTMLQILRAGTYELLARQDVGKAVSISEYVDVAKAFFDDREAKFVNGILDAVVSGAERERLHRGAEALDRAPRAGWKTTRRFSNSATSPYARYHRRRRSVRESDDFADVAWKLVAVNLSDLAAKGAKPLGVPVAHAWRRRRTLRSRAR